MVKYLSAGFESRRIKRAVQTMYYMSSHCKSNVTMLAGPATIAHLNDGLFITNNQAFSTIFIYELNKAIYLKNKEDIKSFECVSKVKLFNDDILKSKFTRVFDFDGCLTLTSSIDSFMFLFNRLYKAKTNRVKHAMFTFTSRDHNGNTTEDNIQLLCDRIGIPNNFKRDLSVPKLRKYDQQFEDTLVSYTTYCDKQPMISFSIQWNLTKKMTL